MSRRRFVESALAWGAFAALPAFPAAPFPVRFRQQHPYQRLFDFIEPGRDSFATETAAAETSTHLDSLLQLRMLPLTPDFQGSSPMPVRHRTIADGIAQAEYDLSDRDFEHGLQKWIASLGQVRAARYFVLPGDRVRYEIASSGPEGLRYRVGVWKQIWSNGKLRRHEPMEETLATSRKAWFEDVTSSMFAEAESFSAQLLRGVPYWRARLDSSAGIDVYGNNGIAVGDIDGDGLDEIYVCQPGGLPNRLYRHTGHGTLEDVTAETGVGVLDNTTCALLLDLRNIGRQDLVVVTTTSPLLFLNEGGKFRHKPDAFRFRSAPQGTFTGMAAADYNRDGRLDLYLCTYIYSQGEDQYRYPVPYYDSQNGPPNFLFQNRLTEDGGGFLDDVTSASGVSQNNDRYSFAPAWSDFDGDGWPDLYVANDFGRNNLYKNDHGQFQDVAAKAGVLDLGPGMSAAWFDYNADGRADLYVSNMWTASGQRVLEDPAFKAAPDAALRDAYRRHTEGNSLYRNRGDGTFESRGAVEGVQMGRWAWSSDGIDFDNDGSPEIYITCGMITNTSEVDLMSFFWRQVVSRSPLKNVSAPAYENGWNALNHLIRGDFSWNGREPNVLYARHGERFYDVSGISGLDCADDSRAFAVTDLDGDGNLDLIVKSRLGPQVRVFRNNCAKNRQAIAFDLRGTRSNRDGIGAQIEIEYSGRRSVKTLQAGSGYLSQHTKRVHFGMGEAQAADTIVIRWPSGSVQTFKGLPAGFRYQIEENSNELARIPFGDAAHLKSKPALRADNQPKIEPTWLLEPVPLPEPGRGPGFLCLFSGTPPDLPPLLPFQRLDLGSAEPDLGAWYALFRMYLFDYRAELTLPLLLLIDDLGRAHKIYPEIPQASILRADLEKLRTGDRLRLGLPFAGDYYTAPERNYFRLGAAFYWSGYPQQSLIYFEECIRRTPENGKAHLAVGHIHLESHRYTAARHHLELAVKLNPNSADAWSNLGSLESALEDYSAALPDFSRALELAPDSVFAVISAARAHGKLGHFAKAEQLLIRAMEIEPQNAEAANQFGLLLAAQNRLPEAVRYFQQSIAAQRNFTAAINNLGVLYMRMQKPADAIAAFRYGIQSAPDDEVSYLNLARAYAAAGDRGAARDVLEKYLQQHPSSGMARQGLEELSNR